MKADFTREEILVSLERMKRITRQVQDGTYTGDKDVLIMNLAGFIENLLESVKKAKGW